MSQKYFCFYRTRLSLFCILVYLIVINSVYTVLSANNNTIGEAIMGSGRTVYLLKGGIRYEIPDWKSFLSLGFVNADIRKYSDDKVNSYPIENFDVFMNLSIGVVSNPLSNGSNNSHETKISNRNYIFMNDSSHLSLCPCRSAYSRDVSNEDMYFNELNKVYTTCIINSTISMELFANHSSDRITSLHIKFISQDLADIVFQTSNAIDPDVSICSAIIRLTKDDVNINDGLVFQNCPGICFPIPYTDISIKWLTPPYVLHQELTCSLTLSAVLNNHTNINNKGGHHNQNHNHHSHEVDIILSSIARRRLEECYEKGRWPLSSHLHTHLHTVGHNNLNANKHNKVKQDIQQGLWSNSTSYLLPNKSIFPRRQVYGLIVWISSTSRPSLYSAQLQVLKLQNINNDILNDSQTIFGWIATEDVYPCRNASEKIFKNNKIENKYNNIRKCNFAYGYHWMLPSTQLSYASAGWACGQRRPLRAMSHVLLLYNPDFLFVVDDDTYINIKLLLYGDILSQIILNELAKQPIVLGQLNGGNKITKKGFFYGGSGYLMGRGLISVLTSHVLHGPRTSDDSVRTTKHFNHLGLMEEAFAVSESNCPKNNNDSSNDCMRLDPAVPIVLHFHNNKAELGVRLIDLCVNVFSEEGTCHHSDHAMSRCLVHAAYADVWDVRCQGFDTPTNPFVNIAMCMGIDNCNSSSLLTCHRWFPNITDPNLLPIPF